MIIIKDALNATNKDVNNSIYYSNSSYDILIDSKSCLQSLLKLGNQIVPKKIYCTDINELFQSCNIHKSDYIQSLYNEWINKEIPFPYNKVFEISNYDKLFQFFTELIYLVIFNRIYKYNTEILTSLKSLYSNLKMINFYNHIVDNPKLWIKDNNNSQSLDITFSTYKFLNNDNHELNYNDLQFIKMSIIDIFSSHINSHKELTIIYTTSLKAENYYYLFKSSGSLLSIGFHELLTMMISDNTNSKITECPVCRKLLVKANGMQTYCSSQCRIKGRKKINYNYNHSDKGKKRTKNFHKSKLKKKEIN